MLLSRLQHLLGGIYDVRIAHDVYDFLVTDRGRLPHAARSGVADEELLVAEPADGSDEVVMSLYLDPALLERLRREDPLRRLHAGNLADCWTALEGVRERGPRGAEEILSADACAQARAHRASVLVLFARVALALLELAHLLDPVGELARVGARGGAGAVASARHALRVGVEVLRPPRAAVVDHLEHDPLVIGGRIFPLDRAVAAAVVPDLPRTPAPGLRRRPSRAVAGV